MTKKHSSHHAHRQKAFLGALLRMAPSIIGGLGSLFGGNHAHGGEVDVHGSDRHFNNSMHRAKESLMRGKRVDHDHYMHKRK